MGTLRAGNWRNYESHCRAIINNALEDERDGHDGK